MHVAGGIAENETCSGGRTVVVSHAQLHLRGGLNIEQHRQFRAKAEVLRLPAHVECDGRLPSARVAAVD